MTGGSADTEAVGGASFEVGLAAFVGVGANVAGNCDKIGDGLAANGKAGAGTGMGGAACGMETEDSESVSVAASGLAFLSAVLEPVPAGVFEGSAAGAPDNVAACKGAATDSAFACVKSDGAGVD